MTEDRKAALAEAMAADYEDGERTATGAPKVDAVNARMPEGSEPVTGEERDEAYMLHIEATTADIVRSMDDVDDEAVRIHLDSAPCDPLTIYIHGRSELRLRVGEEASVTDEVLAALRSSDAAFTIIED